jgi:WD40 repeat protein
VSSLRRNLGALNPARRPPNDRANHRIIDLETAVLCPRSPDRHAITQALGTDERCAASGHWSADPIRRTTSLTDLLDLYWIGVVVVAEDVSMPEQGVGELRTDRDAAVAKQPEYDAFLSYSHAADGRLAPAVQRGLHQLAKPWYQLRALRVFRDQLSLSANPDLWATITAALRGSRFFILLASPDAVASSWVQREVEYWQAHREQATFLIALTDGTIVWDHATGDFDWTRTTALPSQLRGWFHTEPLWVQLDWARSDAQLSVRHSSFRGAIATLAAPIRGVAKDDLDSEDVRQHRRTTRVRNGGIVVLVLLTVVSVILGLVAEQQAHQAQTALQRALARELATRSQALGDIDPAVSTLLSVAAWRLDPTSDARAAMIAAFNRPGIGVFPDGGGAVALSPDHHILATGDTKNGTVHLWDAVTHKPAGAPLIGHTDLVGPIKFSPRGNTLATGSADGTVRLWDTASHRQLGDPLTPAGGVIVALAFSRDGNMLATGSAEGTVQLWDTASHRQLGDPFEGYDTGAIAFSPDGHALAFFGRDNTVRLWDIASRRQLSDPLTGFVGQVFAIAFSPDGRFLATGGADGAVRLWEVATYRSLRTLMGFKGGIETGGGGVHVVAFSADGGTLTASGYNGTVRSWDLTTGSQIGDVLTGAVGMIGSSFSPDGDILAISGNDGTVRLWNLANRNHRGTPFTDSDSGSSSAVFSPDGRILAIGYVNGTVRLWDVASHAQIGTALTGGTGAITSIVFSPDGRSVAVGGFSSPVQLWDIVTHTPIGGPLTNYSGEPIAFGSDGRTLLTTGSTGHRVWDVATRTSIANFQTENSVVAAMSGDSRVLAIGADDGKVQLWDFNTRTRIGDPLAGSRELVSLAFSSDRRTLAVGSRHGNIQLWDITRHTPLGDPLSGSAAEAITAMVFSPNGATLATASETETGHLWDVASHLQVGTPLIPRPAETIGSVAFSPDGHTLVTSTDGVAARLWDVPSTAQVDSVLCTRVGRSLTPDEWHRYIPDLPYQQVCPRTRRAPRAGR